MAKVYGMYNQTKKQRYYGRTTQPVNKRLGQHKAGQTPALSKWNFEKDKILARTIAKGLSPAKATKKAHKLELRKPPPGWKTIQTGGR